MLKPQKEFPHLERYKQVFNITDKTVFAYDMNIYSDYDLPYHLIVHENVHFQQQKKWGLDTWTEMYLTDKNFRAMQEVEAYLAEIQSIKDRNERLRHRMYCAKVLSSDLYNVMSCDEAYKLLK